MSIFASKSTRAIAFAMLCLGGSAAHAQVAPVRYWLPGGLFGFGGPSDSTGPYSTGNFPSFDFSDSAQPVWRNNLPAGAFVRSESGSVNLSGIGQTSAFGGFGALSYDSVQIGNNFKGVGGLPVTVFAGFDTLRVNPGALAPLSGFSSSPGVPAAYTARAGIEFQPAPNISLSLGAGFAQSQSGRLDSDINSNLLPGETPFFAGGRR